MGKCRGCKGRAAHSAPTIQTRVNGYLLSSTFLVQLGNLPLEVGNHGAQYHNFLMFHLTGSALMDDAAVALHFLRELRLIVSKSFCKLFKFVWVHA